MIGEEAARWPGSAACLLRSVVAASKLTFVVCAVRGAHWLVDQATGGGAHEISEIITHLPNARATSIAAAETAVLKIVVKVVFELHILIVTLNPRTRCLRRRRRACCVGDCDDG